jgi:ferredoxin
MIPEDRKEPPMKVTIDREECVSCGTCYETCGELFEENPDDSWSQIKEKYRTGGDLAAGEVPKELEACAKEAEDACPVEVIHTKG